MYAPKFLKYSIFKNKTMKNSEKKRKNYYCSIIKSIGMLECSFYVIDCQSSYIFPCTCTNSCFSCCRLSKLYLLQLKTNKTQKKWTTFVNVSSERVNRISIFFVASPILFYFCNKFIFSFRVPNVIKINLDVVCCSLLLLLFFRCRYSFYSGNGTIVVPSLSTVRFILFKKK